MNIYHIQNDLPSIFEGNSNFESTSEDLQRTDKWFNDRKGRFTGSEIKKLMGTTASTKSIEWGRPEKVIDFSEIAKKYIFEKAKERQTNTVLERSIGFNGDYGKTAEPQIVTILQEKYPACDIKEYGFIEFIEGIAGSSPDGSIDTYALEIKAAMSWDGVYNRFELPFDQKHIDFWQIQSEMLSLQTDKCLYVVADPAKSFNDIIITNIQEKLVEASPIHQTAIIQRCMIGDLIIKKYLSGVEFHEAVRQGCVEFDFSNN